MKLAGKITAALLCAAVAAPGLAMGAGTVFASAATDVPCNITVGVGSNESETRFCWQSTSSAAGELQIAKTSSVTNGQFPTGSDRAASVTKLTATEGYLDNAASTNTDRPVSSYKDANGAALADEYADKVTVSGLSAGTSYTYRVGDGKNWSKSYTYTPQSAANGFSFAAFGDPQVGASGNLANDTAGWAKTLKKVFSKYPSLNFLYSMGDQVNDYDHLYTQQQEYTSFFNPDSSADYLQTHLLAAYSGNHDFQMGRYFSYHYNFPNLSTLGQTMTNNVADGNGDYWFRYGNTLFMNLEGNNFYDVSAHDSFLKQAIAANQDARWKVVSFHQAPYSEANHDGATSADDDIMFIRNNWTKLMDKYGIDIVLNGHDHYYTRSYQMYGGSPVSAVKTNSVKDPKGTVYFTLDSGSGSKFYKYNTTADHSFSAFGWQNKQPTYTYAKVTGNTFTLTTYTSDTDTQIDTYTITKTTGGSVGAGKTANVAATLQNPKTGDNETLGTVILTISALVLMAAAIYAFRRSKRNA